MKKQLTFPEITVKYLKALSKNNNKEWFEANRERFTFEFLEPAVQFVVDLGEKLSGIRPELQYFPRIDKSIFRLYRDVRFSKNKAPFKENLGILLWEGSDKKKECSGYYFHLEPGSFFIATGMYMFSKEQLSIYREKVADPTYGKELSDIINHLSKNKNFRLGGNTFKRVPKGFDPDYKYANLLLHSGLYVYLEPGGPFPANKDIVEYCYQIYKKQTILHDWLVKNIA